jgi:hypothetical protein
MSDQVNISEKTSISFPFHPFQFPNAHTIFKEESGIKRKYLCGITSGIKLDAHEERMTTNAIKSFMEQANSGDILLYPDSHGIKASEDIGILSKGEILPDNDWYTEYRLYDEDDDIGQYKLEKIDTIWKQLNGQPPYKKPRQKGFSIEGYIPENAIISAEADNFGNLRKRMIDDVKLDGVLLVPRQAYKTGIANALYKALQELPPWQEKIIQKDIKGELQKILSENEESDGYYRKRWDLLDALDRAIDRIINGNLPDKKRQLSLVFDEYKDIMIPLILQSESVFNNTAHDDDINPYEKNEVGKVSKIDIFKSLVYDFEKLTKIIDQRY